MMRKLKLYAGFLTLTLSLGAFSPTILCAQEVSKKITSEGALSTDVLSARKADLETLMNTLESKHPNIYNKNDKAVFDKKLMEFQSQLATMSDFEFALAVSELTALIGDAHTKAAIGSVLGAKGRFLPVSVVRVKEGLLVTDIPDEHKQVLGGILTSINGVSMDEIKEKLTPMMSFDNEVYLDGQFVGAFYVYEILEHYGILNSPKDITLEIKLGDKVETIKVDAGDRVTQKAMKFAWIECPASETEMDKSKMYFFKPLNKDTLYIQYNACFEDESLPMDTFAQQINDKLTQESYKRVILDLRYNSGGSDGVILPLMYVLEEKNKQDGVQLYTLIGRNTFSSAMINAVMLKQIGSVMVGSPTGGSVDHFGSVSNFELPNSKIAIRYSNKYIDLSTLLEVAKPYDIQSFSPDILAEQTSQDYLKGRDVAVQAALADTKNKAIPKTEVTRGVLAARLGREYFERTDKTIDSLQSSFTDVSRISYLAPYVTWASSNQIMVGENETTFSPDKTVTRAEVAVAFMKYAELLGVSLKELPKTDNKIEDINLVKEEEKNAVDALGGTAIFPLNEGKFQPDAVISREAFETMFKEFISYIDLK